MLKKMIPAIMCDVFRSKHLFVRNWFECQHEETVRSSIPEAECGEEWFPSHRIFDLTPS